MLKRKGLMFALTAALGLSAVIAGVDYAGAQEADCGNITGQISEAKQEYKQLLHEQKKAFEDWDKYYTQLHSDTYAGTEEPIADSAEKCESGEDSEQFCKGTMEVYNQILVKEQETKKAFDEAKKKAEQAGGRLHELQQQAKEGNCE